PPTLVLSEAGAVTLYLPLLGHEFWRIAAEADCGEGLAGILALDCRAAAVWHAVTEPTVASALLPRSVLVIVAVAVAVWAAHDSIALSTPAADHLVHVRGRRLRQDATARGSLRRHLVGIGRPDEKSLWLVPHVQLPPAA